MFKKIGIVGAGILGNSLLDTTSNVGVFASMFFSYFIVSVLFLKIYDFLKVDFVEDAKEKTESVEKNTTQKVRYFFFLAILFTFDSLLFILRVRPGHHKYNGVGGVKMWMLLVMSCMTFSFMLLNVLAFTQR